MVFFRPTVPLAQARGCEYGDRSEHLILVQSTLDQVAKGFDRLKEGDSWQADCYGCEITVAYQSFILFQLRWHSWSVIQGLTAVSSFNDDDAKGLSRLLKAPVIYFWVSSGAGTVGYFFYQSGDLVEQFAEDAEPSDFEEDNDLQAIREIRSPAQKRRPLALARSRSTEESRRSFERVDAFLHAQDAYVPCIFKPYLTFRPGQRQVLWFKNLDQQDLDRMDYIGINRFPRPIRAGFN